MAEEVRKLAEESQRAAAEISGLVGAIQDETTKAVNVVDDGARRTEDGASVVEKTREAFQRIESSVDDMTARIEQIAAASEQVAVSATSMQQSIAEVAAVAEESSASTEEVSASTVQTSASTEQTSASAEQIAASAQELSGNAGQRPFRIGLPPRRRRSNQGFQPARPGAHSAAYALSRLLPQPVAGRAGRRAPAGGSLRLIQRRSACRRPNNVGRAGRRLKDLIRSIHTIDNCSQEC